MFWINYGAHFYDDEDMKKYGCVSGDRLFGIYERNDVIEACYYINSDNSYGAMNMLAIVKSVKMMDPQN